MSAMQTVRAIHFYYNTHLLNDYELCIDGEWQTFYDAGVYRMPDSPVLFYRPEGEISVPWDKLIEVRPKQ